MRIFFSICRPHIFYFISNNAQLQLQQKGELLWKILFLLVVLPAPQTLPHLVRMLLVIRTPMSTTITITTTTMQHCHCRIPLFQHVSLEAKQPTGDFCLGIEIQWAVSAAAAVSTATSATAALSVVQLQPMMWMLSTTSRQMRRPGGKCHQRQRQRRRRQVQQTTRQGLLHTTQPQLQPQPPQQVTTRVLTISQTALRHPPFTARSRLLPVCWVLF